MSKKEPVEGEGFVIKDKRSSQISEDAATFLDDQETNRVFPDRLFHIYHVPHVVCLLSLGRHA